MSEPLLIQLGRETAELLDRRAWITHRRPAVEAAVLLAQALETWQLQDSLRSAYLRRLVEAPDRGR